MLHMAAESASFSGVLWFMMMSRNLMNEPFSRALVKMSAMFDLEAMYWMRMTASSAQDHGP